MVLKQDRQGVRTAADLERKYNLVGIEKAVKQSEEGINKTNTTLENFMNETINHFEVMQGEIDTDTGVLNVVIESSNGDIFKNGDIESTLSVKVYHLGVDVTSQYTDSQFSWTRVSKEPEADLIWNNAHQYTKSIVITNEDVNVKAVFNVVFNYEIGG